MQGLDDVHGICVPPTQTPSWHESFWVQVLPSLQAPFSFLASVPQTPLMQAPSLHSSENAAQSAAEVHGPGGPPPAPPPTPVPVPVPVPVPLVDVVADVVSSPPPPVVPGDEIDVAHAIGASASSEPATNRDERKRVKLMLAKITRLARGFIGL